MEPRARGSQGARKIEDSELVARALEGSEDAFRELVLRYQKPVFSLILRMIRDRALADDLAQESFVKAYRALASFDSRRKFSSWLFKIAHNSTIDHLRRAKIPTQPLEDDASEGRSLVEAVEDDSIRSPEDLARSSELGQALEHAISGLRPDYRAVMLLRFVQGFSYQEISEITGLALGTVKTNIHRARKELATQLEESGWK